MHDQLVYNVYVLHYNDDQLLYIFHVLHYNNDQLISFVHVITTHDLIMYVFTSGTTIQDQLMNIFHVLYYNAWQIAAHFPLLGLQKQNETKLLTEMFDIF